MRVVLVPDSYKGTFSSMEVIAHVKKGMSQHFNALEFIEIPIADGGEGTVQAMTHVLGGSIFSCNVQDALGNLTTAHYGICGEIGIIEMAEAAGLMKLDTNVLNILDATTYGVGETLLKVLEHKPKRLIIGIGGSATNDGGVGMLQALGIRFYNRYNQLISKGGRSLALIDHIDTAGLDPRLKAIPITVMCDVKNPLTGPNGATYVYGPQKGANKEELEFLEQGMLNYKTIIEKQVGIDVDQIPGTGAAGGLGAAFVSFLNGELKSGIDMILDLVQFESLLRAGDLVITGEGCLDNQTLHGKVPIGVAKRCSGKDVKVIALVGTEGENAKAVLEQGIDAIVSTTTRSSLKPLNKEEAEERLKNSVDNLCRLLKIGQKFGV